MLALETGRLTTIFVAYRYGQRRPKIWMWLPGICLRPPAVHPPEMDELVTTP